MLVTLALRLVNPLNTREHWAKRAKRAREHRGLSCMALRAIGIPKTSSSVVVTLTRISPRPFDDHDALPAAFKACVDGVADAMGLKSDRTQGVTWVYAWRRGKPKEHAVEILVEALT